MNVMAVVPGQRVRLDRATLHDRMVHPSALALFLDRVGVVRDVDHPTDEHVMVSVDFGNGTWHGPAWMLAAVLEDA